MKRLTASATARRLAFRPSLQNASNKAVSSASSLAALRRSGPSQSPLRPLSDMAVERLLTWEEMPSAANDAQHRNYDTHSCEDDNGVLRKLSDRNSTDTNSTDTNNEGAPLFPCGSPKHEDDFGHLPPPLPEPAYSVHKRILPTALTGLSSKKGREYLLQSLVQNTAESYWALMEQFVNQSDPAFCGVTTLLMVLNAMCIDPNVRWRGGWRFFGSEEVLLDRCCLSMERISRVGVTLEEFRLLARCHGLGVDMKRPFPSDDLEKETILKQHHRPTEFKSLEAFRDDIRKILTTPNSKSHLVVSFSRVALEQTGDGHFSPIAAYHEETDQVLVLDVARFKYAPYWVPVISLYHAMRPNDLATKRSRGWFLLHPPENHACLHQTQEVRRPAELVPMVGDPDVCPMGRVKVEYCKANPKNQTTQGEML